MKRLIVKDATFSNTNTKNRTYRASHDQAVIKKCSVHKKYSENLSTIGSFKEHKRNHLKKETLEVCHKILH